jgi:diphosphomevalonate decarboxylase
MGRSVATARAHANIALVKYWGKRDSANNLPAAGSLSLTLEPLTTQTRVEVAERDQVVLNGAVADAGPAARALRFLDLLAQKAGREERPPLRVVSHNLFPTGAGLASSASGFAALTVAGAAALEIEADPKTLSEWARHGSGSAARSIFAGFVRMHREGWAEPLEDVGLELGAVVVVVDDHQKDVGSTDGMEHTRRTSPYHDAWIRQVDADLAAAEQALRDRDLQRLADITEGNTLAMHANAMAARPGLLYWRPDTLAAVDRVRGLRSSGVPTFFTIDAGPHVVAFAPSEHLDRVERELRDLPGTRLIRARAGGPAERLDRTS